MLELLNLKDINKKYGIKPALKNINLNIESGKKMTSYISVRDAALRAKSTDPADIKAFIYQYLAEKISKSE